MSERIKVTDTMMEWRYSLRAANKSPETIRAYMTAASKLSDFLETEGMSTLVPDISASHCRMFLASLYERGMADTSVLSRWASLKAYWKFLTETGIADTNVMRDVQRPKVETKVIPEVHSDDKKKLMATCDRKSFMGARDYAIMLLLCRGMRRAEVCGITLDDVDFRNDQPTITINGKGSRWRRVYVSPRDAQALIAYMRIRRAWIDARPEGHKTKTCNALFVTKYGAITGQAVELMLVSRCATAGLPRSAANAHKWRHTWAGDWKANGGSDEGLMAQGGWVSGQQIRRYTAHNRERTSIAEAARLAMD